MGMEGLGKDYDLVANMIPADASAGAPTVDRINMRNADGVDVILFMDVGAAADVPVITIQQHIGIAGAGIALLVDHYYLKSALLLATSPVPWVRVANGVAGVGITTITTVAPQGVNQLIMVIPIEAAQLAAGYDVVCVQLAQTAGAGTKYASMLYLLRNLHIQRAPANLPNPII